MSGEEISENNTTIFSREIATNVLLPFGTWIWEKALDGGRSVLKQILGEMTWWMMGKVCTWTGITGSVWMSRLGPAIAERGLPRGYQNVTEAAGDVNDNDGALREVEMEEFYEEGWDQINVDMDIDVYNEDFAIANI